MPRSAVKRVDFVDANGGIVDRPHVDPRGVLFLRRAAHNATENVLPVLHETAVDEEVAGKVQSRGELGDENGHLVSLPVQDQRNGLDDHRRAHEKKEGGFHDDDHDSDPGATVAVAFEQFFRPVTEEDDDEADVGEGQGHEGKEGVEETQEDEVSQLEPVASEEWRRHDGINATGGTGLGDRFIRDEGGNVLDLDEQHF